MPSSPPTAAFAMPAKPSAIAATAAAANIDFMVLSSSVPPTRPGVSPKFKVLELKVWLVAAEFLCPPVLGVTARN
jgi:hypothetical protein